MVSTGDRVSWKVTENKLYQARLKFEPEERSPHITPASPNYTIDSSDADQDDDVEWFDQISDICQGLAWNVVKNDSRLFSFTTYKISGTMTCALSDADLNSTYEYACQYGLSSLKSTRTFV